MYKRDVFLKHNERLAKFSVETGEMEELGVSGHRRNVYMADFDGIGFSKSYDAAWELLAAMSSKEEYAVASMLSNRIKSYTNSLDPLCDGTSLLELSSRFKVSRNRVRIVFDRLLGLGVYGKFNKVVNGDKKFPHGAFWVFNPYLKTKSKKVDLRSSNLFIDTSFAKLHRADAAK